MLKMEEELAKYGVPLAINQCEFSVLRRLPETEGLFRRARSETLSFNLIPLSLKAALPVNTLPRILRRSSIAFRRMMI